MSWPTSKARSLGRFHESHADVFRPFDDERIVVEGRMRWMDDERVLRDDPVVWALEFRDGLLWRSTPAVTVLEAETLLAVSTWLSSRLLGARARACAATRAFRTRDSGV